MVVFLCQRVNAGKDAIGCLEACSAVVPVYAKERVLGFLPGVKIVSISRNNNWFLKVKISGTSLSITQSILEIGSSWQRRFGNVLCRSPLISLGPYPVDQAPSRFPGR